MSYSKTTTLIPCPVDHDDIGPLFIDVLYKQSEL